MSSFNVVTFGVSESHMLPGEQIAEKVLFGCFEVNLITCEVFRNGRKLRLSGQPAQVLMILLQRPGQLVTREDLRAMLWPGETFVDFDHGLNNCINRIREALGDEAASPEWIETLPKRGYRFIAPIRHVRPTLEHKEDGQGLDGSESISVQESPKVAAVHIAGFWTARMVSNAAIALVAVGTIAATWLIIHGKNSKPDGAVANIRSVAVLPVANLSGDSNQEYLTDGFTDQLITELARNTSAPVISRTSIMLYKNRQTPIPMVALELGVDAVVETSLQRTGNHFKISASLIPAKSDTHLWAQSYEAEMGEVPQMAARIASDIAAQLHQPAARRDRGVVSSVSAEAYDEYLKGQFFWNHFQTESALRHLQRAVALQPDYAAAYAGIAKSYCRFEYQQILPAAQAFPPANAAVKKALELDPHNGEAHAALSYLSAQRDWDWNRADEELRIAIAEDPGNSMGHRWFRFILRQKGRDREALEQARLSVKADPASANLISVYAMELAHNKRYAEAIATFKDALEFEPNDAGIRFGLADAYENSGKLDLAAAELEKAYRLSGRADLADRFHNGYARDGYKEAAETARRTDLQRELQLLKRRSARREYVSPTAYVYLYAGLGDRENTLRWLESAYAADAHVMVELRDERFDFVRQEPRFKRIWDNVPFSH
jgi:TolB-like protein/DNA-binding winged helix-turn-helix (wHTH) protein